MSSDLFDIVFRGDIILGHNIQTVKQRLSQLFKIDAAKVDALFAGGAVPLKRNVDQATAEKYKAVLAEAGAQVQIRPAGQEEAKPRPRPVRAKTESAALTSTQPEKKLSLKERLAQQAAEDAKNKQQAPVVKQVEIKSPDGAFSLAPVGSNLSEPKKPPVATVAVDTGSISLKPLAGELLDPSEKKPAPTSTVTPGNFDVADVGADLLKPSERKPTVTSKIKITAFDIAEVGADLLDAADKLVLPEVEIDTSEFSLAPVGSDLGQKKKDPPPPPPDTSSLSLSK
jgi:hypothetical protein